MHHVSNYQPICNYNRLNSVLETVAAFRVALVDHRPDLMSPDLIDDATPLIWHLRWSLDDLVRSREKVGAIGFHEYPV